MGSRLLARDQQLSARGRRGGALDVEVGVSVAAEMVRHRGGPGFRTGVVAGISHLGFWSSKSLAWRTSSNEQVEAKASRPFLHSRAAVPSHIACANAKRRCPRCPGAQWALWQVAGNVLCFRLHIDMLKGPRY